MRRASTECTRSARRERAKFNELHTEPLRACLHHLDGQEQDARPVVADHRLGQAVRRLREGPRRKELMLPPYARTGEAARRLSEGARREPRAARGQALLKCAPGAAAPGEAAAVVVGTDDWTGAGTLQYLAPAGAPFARASGEAAVQILRPGMPIT
jgi:hypothetical protein